MEIPKEELFLSNPNLKAYLFYTGILIVKMMIMSPLTTIQRYKKIKASKSGAFKKKENDTLKENIERVRRGHLNDLENILIFFVISFCYIMTNPSEIMAITLLRTYTVSRILHTIVYTVLVIPQPARAITWLTGYGVTGYMLLCSLVHFCC